MAEDKKTKKKASTKTETSESKNQGPGFGIEKLFLKDVSVEIPNSPPEDGMEMVLAITCPNILFPYAREAISDLVTKAGFSPVLLNPINFETMYMQQKEKDAGAAKRAN